MKLSANQQLVIDCIAGAMIMNNCYVPSPTLRRAAHALQAKKLVEFVKYCGLYRYALTAKGQQHVDRPYSTTIGYVVAAAELTVLKMTSGNEKRYSQVIDNNGRVKTWVGIGWIDDGEPTILQQNTLPEVIGTWS